MRYDQETLKAVRDYENDLSRFNKVSLNIVLLIEIDRIESYISSIKAGGGQNINFHLGIFLRI